MIVTGDPSQVDLPPGQTSGLAEAVRLLGDVPGHVGVTSPSPILTSSFAMNWSDALSPPTTRLPPRVRDMIAKNQKHARTKIVPSEVDVFIEGDGMGGVARRR